MRIKFNKIFDPSVMLSATKVALVVGPVITLVNQWDLLLAGQLNVLKAILSFLIPYTVSTVSFLLAYSKVDDPAEEPVVAAPNSNADGVNLEQLIKRLDALVVILEQKHNQDQLATLTYKTGASATDKPLNLVSELKHLQVAFKQSM